MKPSRKAKRLQRSLKSGSPRKLPLIPHTGELTHHTMTDSEKQDLHDAADILETEANELAALMDMQPSRFNPTKPDKPTADLLNSLPKRTWIAVSTEMNRLRRIAGSLQHLAGPEKNSIEDALSEE